MTKTQIFEEAIDLLEFCGEKSVILKETHCSDRALVYQIANKRGFPVSTQSHCGQIRIIARKILESTIELLTGEEADRAFFKFLRET